MVDLRARLEALAHNLWWCWNPEAGALFRALDPERWSELHHNPVHLLAELSDDTLHARVALPRLHAVEAQLHDYLGSNSTWARRNVPALESPVAYFSMEFALHESLPIYSGGLGVLAGDHLKSASDLGIPFVAVGLLYREGYFKQVIEYGGQVAAYPRVPLDVLPLKKLDVVVEVPHGKGHYKATAWEIAVGRVKLYLLDADLPGNDPIHRELSRHLYGGDDSTRIRQEVLLGIGGMRLLRALGIEPSVVHMNEGHCAFAVLELMREQIALGKKPGAALAAAREKCVFTTHTPVPAGHDRFSWDLKNQALMGLRAEMGLPEGYLMELGREKPGNLDESLCMTVLALRGSRAANGVAALHGEVSRKMWAHLWPDRQLAEVPIGHVTNGVHVPSWIHPRVSALLDRVNPGWRDGAPVDLSEVSDAELWAIRNDLRFELVGYARRRTGHKTLISQSLCIGFARRFAPYKRGSLLFSDPDRLARLLFRHPIQLFYAGKAHPRDEAGQAIIREVLRWTREERFRGRVVFLPDYDVELGRRLTQGVDLWLNLPRRPREASGTSGMKVPLNLGVNASVLDGWWPEAYDGTNGFAVGKPVEYASVGEQDAADAESLFRILEDEVVPEFFDRDAHGIPQAWVARMRRSLETCLQAFHTDRMVGEYARRFYLDPSAAR
ncbi:MAG: alpha-glucan family phosphorylase [Deltaproteobacteria bacterium]|nr:alpha-glucan family phosphorylase [Deltaproteobacteria bacterium]